MTRAQAYAEEARRRRTEYAEGFSDGSRWAERDIQARSRTELLAEGIPTREEGGDAYELGCRRGYRDTWARWDAGTLTWEQLEHAPTGR